MNAVADKNLTPADTHANERGLLRFITAGSVDDGKSTLIGRLLFDSKGIFAISSTRSHAHVTSAPWVIWSIYRC